MLALSGLLASRPPPATAAAAAPAVDPGAVSEQHRILLNYEDIEPAEYLSTVLELGINHTHPQIDSSDGDSYSDLLYKRLHCAAEVLRWQTAARLSVLFALGYDEIMQFVTDAAQKDHIENLNKHLVATEAVLTSPETFDFQPNLAIAQRNVLSTLVDLLPPRNRHSTRRDQRGFSECDRFAEVCKGLFGEDHIPNEDYLYDKARLKIAEQKLQQLVHDGYKAREPTEVRRDIQWLLGRMVDGLYLRAALDQHCSAVYDLLEEVFCLGDSRIDRTQLVQQSASFLLRLAREVIRHVTDLCSNVGDFPRIGPRLRELRDAMHPPEWIEGHEGGLALPKRQELIAYLQHAGDWFHKVHESGDEHELAQMLPSSSRQGRGTLIRCKDYLNGDEKKVMISSRRYEVNNEAAVVEIGVACHQKYRAVFENGDLWLVVDEKNGRPLQTVMGHFERLALMTGDLVIEIELHTPAAARSLNSREHIFLPCSATELSVVPSEAPATLSFVPYAMYVTRSVALSVAQRRALGKLAENAQTAGITACEVVDFLTFVELFHNPPADAQTGRESALELMQRKHPIEASRLLYGSFRPQYAEVCFDFVRQFRDAWMAKLSNKDGSQDAGQLLVLSLICATDLDAHMAIASPQAFHMALDQILQVTKHRVVQVSVHSSNYESVFRQAVEINRATSLSFMCLHIADNVSTADIVGLLSVCETGSLRMVVHETPHVVSSVQNRISPNKVILIRSEKREALLQRDAYRHSTNVGAVVQAVAHTPLHVVRRILEESADMTQSPSEPFDVEEEQVTPLMVLVISDPDALKNYFQANRVHVIDAIYKRDIERFISTYSSSSQSAKRAATRLVLLRAELLSSEYLSVLAMRSENLAIKLTLVTTCLPMSHIRRLKLEPSQVSRIDVTADMAQLQFQKAGLAGAREDSSKKAAEESHTWTAGDLLVLYRICRLMLGKQFLLSAAAPTLLTQLHSREVEAVTEQFKRFSGVGVETGAIRAFVRQLCSLVAAGLSADLSDLFPAKSMGAGDVEFSWRDKSASDCISNMARVMCAAVQHTEMDSDVPFEDFTRQHAMMSFLPQKTRLELWVSSICCQAVGQQVLVEFPEGHNCHCLQPLVYFAAEPISEPGYVSLPRGDLFTVEDYVHRSVQDDEFDWNFCHHEPQLNQISTDNLLTMLQAYRYPLKLLLSLRARSLFEYLDRHMGEQWRPVMLHIATKLSQLLHFLSAVDLEEVVHSHLSVLKWTIGLHTSGVRGQLLTVSERNIDELVRLKLPICVASDRSRLEQSLPLFIQLEGPPNFLYNQAELRDALVTTQHSKLEQLLTRADSRGSLLGAAFVSFILNQHVQEMAQNYSNANSGLFAHPLIRTLTSVLTAGDTLAETDTRPVEPEKLPKSKTYCEAILKYHLPHHVASSTAVKTGLRSMSPRAWATMVLATIQDAQVDWLFAALISSEPWRVHLANDEPRAAQKRFCVRVLDQLNEELESSRREHWLSYRFLHHVLRYLQSSSADYGADRGVLEQKGDDRDTAMLEVITLAQKETLFAKVAADLQDGSQLSTIEFCKRRRRQCPIESMPFLCEMYLKVFGEVNDDNIHDQIDLHLDLLSPQAWNVILRRFHSSEMDNPLAYGWLVLIAWAKSPYTSLPIRDKRDANCLTAVVKHPRVAFKHLVDANLSRVAPLGLFLGAPDYLNTTTYNYYAQLFGLPQITASLLLIGQQNHPSYPPYFVSVYPRKLSLNRLLEEFEQQWLPQLRATAAQFKQDPRLPGAYEYNLLTGISLETLRENLRSLVAILYLSRVPSDYQSDGTREMAAFVVTLWFAAAGVPRRKVTEWLNTIDPQLVTILDGMNITHTHLVYQPFPALCSPQLMTSGGEKLFGSHERDFQFTMQTWQAIDPQKSPVSRMQESLGRRERVFDTTGARILYERWQPTDRYLHGFPEECSRAFGERVVGKVLHVENMQVSQPAAGKTVIQVDYTPIQSALTPFARLLLLCVDPSRCHANPAELLPRIIEQFLTGFKNGCRGKTNDNRHKYAAPILFRALMSAVGISAALRTEAIHATIVRAFQHLQLEPCQASLNELQFFERVNLHNLRLTPRLEFSQRGVFVQIAAAPLLAKSAIDNIASTAQAFKSIGLTNSTSTVRGERKEDLGPLEMKEDEFIQHAELRSLFTLKEQQAKVALSGGDTSEAVTSSGQQRDRPITKPCIICCDDLLVVEKYKGFATIRLTPGKTVTLVKIHSDSAVQSHELYTFVTNAGSHMFAQQMNGLFGMLQPICALNDHQAAFNFILELPVGSVLYTQGVLLTLMPDKSFRPYFNTTMSMPTQGRTLFDCLDAIELLKLRVDNGVYSILVACARAIVASFDKKYPILAPDPDAAICRQRFRVVQQKAFQDKRPFLMLQMENRCHAVAMFVGLVMKTVRGATSTHAFSFDRAFATIVENIANGAIDNKRIKEGYDILKPILSSDPAGGGSLLEKLKQLRGVKSSEQLLQLLEGGTNIPEVELILSGEAAAASADIVESVLHVHRAFFVDIQAAKQASAEASDATPQPGGGFEEFDFDDDADEYLAEDDDAFDFDMVPVDLDEQNAVDLDRYASAVAKHLADQNDAALSEWENEKWQAFVNSGRAVETGRGRDFIRGDAFSPGALQGANCAQLRFVNPPMDERRYSPEHGTALLFVLPPPGPAVQAQLQQLDMNGRATLCTQLLQWLCHVVRAPLRKTLKECLCSLVINDSQEFLEHSMDEKACMLGLAHVCPIPSIQALLRDSLRTADNSPLERLCARSDGRYGIRFTHRRTLYELQELGVAVERLDFTVEYENKTDSLSNMYLRIIDELVAGSCSFVYVQGLPKVDDTLLKWCSEFTPRNPWCWIFFEDSSTVFNLVENIDRAIIDEQRYVTEDDQLRALDKKPRMFEDGVIPLDLVTTDLPTRKAADWEQRFEDCLENLPWVMLAGDPGIGKTYYLNEDVMNRDNIKREYAVVQRVDGSSDRFVRDAITDVLDALVAAADGKKMLLCLDEFHMMTPTQKRQLLLWTKGHTSNVKLVMISNRLDQADFNMFQDILQQRENQIIEARGTMSKLMEKQVMRILEGNVELTARRGAVLSFVFLWVRSARSLFGDLMMTMRPIPELIQKIGDDDRLFEYLSKFLQKKIPTLSKAFCNEYLKQLLRIYHEMFQLPELMPDLSLEYVTTTVNRHTQKILRRGFPSTDPVHVLVYTSLLDSRLDSDDMPYPEYSALLPAHHPFRRLACWVAYVTHRECTRRGVQFSTPLDKLIQELEAGLHGSMEIVDLPMRFPRLRRTAAPSGLKNTCDVLCSSVHPSDLQGLIDALQRGYTIDVDEAKRYWSVNPVTDVASFDRLLSNYSTLLPLLFDTGPYMQSMASMVQTLIRHSDELGLAQKCVNQLTSSARERTLSPSRTTQLVAFWKIYRFSALPTTSRFGIDLTSLQEGQHHRPEDAAMLGLLSDLFAWASEFGYNSLEVLNRTNDRSQLLCAHILLCMHHLSRQLLEVTFDEATTRDAFRCIKSYATNLFSGSLIDPASEEAFVVKTAADLGAHGLPALFRSNRISENGVPNAIWMLLAKTQPASRSEWPMRLQLLCRLFHGAANASDIDRLVVAHGVWRDVFESRCTLSDDLRDEFVSRILQSTDQLYVNTQEAILRTPQLEVNEPELANDVVAAKFRDTLTRMAPDDVLIPRCLLKTKLLEEMSKLQGM